MAVHMELLKKKDALFRGSDAIGSKGLLTCPRYIDSPRMIMFN